MNAFLNNDDFDKGLINLAENAESNLPEGSWERLRLKQAHLKHRKKILLVITISSVLVLIIAASFFFLEYHDHSPAEKQNSGNSSSADQNTDNAVSTYTRNANVPETGNGTNETVNPVSTSVPVYYNIGSLDASLIIDQAEEKIYSSQNKYLINEKDLPVIENIFPEKEAQTVEQASEQIFITLHDSVLKDTNLSVNIIKDSTTTSDITVNNSKSDEPGNEFHFGPVIDLNSTWILNQNTYGEFGGKELAYTLHFGTAYGISFGYDIGRRYGFEAAIILNSHQGQGYHDVLSIGEFDRDVRLNYFYIPVVYKWKCYIRKSENPVVLNLIGGIKYGHIKSAEEILNGIHTDITERFNKNEFGFVFNMESDIYFARSFYFTLGLCSSIGNNINGKDWMQYVSHANGRSHNFLLGAAFGLSYYFPVK